MKHLDKNKLHFNHKLNKHLTTTYCGVPVGIESSIALDSTHTYLSKLRNIKNYDGEICGACSLLFLQESEEE